MPTNGNGLSGDEHVRASQKAADARVQVALRSIEEAQRLLDQASQALCSVRGMVVEWRKVGALHDQVKGSWCAVDRRASRLIRTGRLVLDHEPGSYEAHWTRLLEDGRQP
jgi:hypothetical protein